MSKQKLILNCSLSPGDLVMLSAAIRDLHRCYPGKFQTDVRTPCPDLWLHNPLLTPLNENAPEVNRIDCEYPLINQCDRVPKHCLHGFVDFLNERLGLNISLSAFKGHIPLAPQERTWYSQVQELTGEPTPFWLLNAGGKYDVTVKWWNPERFQAVVDHFRGRILFVQIGQRGHHHPTLRGVVDLRGRTSLRQLVRLVYHAQGVLCPITAVMHLAAAIETKPDGPPLRPCVVVAGGREPAHWEAYPGHQFIHTIGALSCCARGGCWRDRVTPLGDGDPRDDASRLCLQVVEQQPRCLDLISARDVIDRIETYFAGGALPRLSPAHWNAGRRAVRSTARHSFDRLPLTWTDARVRFEQAVRTLPPLPAHLAGRGIVIPAGGCRFFTNAWVNIRRLRELKCRLPIQVWHLGPQEMRPEMVRLLASVGATCVDAEEIRQQHPCRRLGGWELKTYAMAHCPFAEVLLLDADNVAVTDPEFLFNTGAYTESGALFWPDGGRLEKTQKIWDLLGLPRPSGPEFESGQILLDKRRCWRPLALACWLNDQSDFFYRYLHGDKETLHLAFERLRQPYIFIATPPLNLAGAICQHDPHGARIFQHRNTNKWTLFANQRWIDGFQHDDACRAALIELREQWDSRSLLPGDWQRRLRAGTAAKKPATIQAGMISCEARREVRAASLERLARTDWADDNVLIQLDDPEFIDPRDRQQRAALALLQRFLLGKASYLLFLEDDLEFNRHLRHNLQHWSLFQRRQIALAGLYNPGLVETACDLSNRAMIVEPSRVYGSQAFLVSRPAAEYFVRHWNEVDGMQDIRMSRLLDRFRPPVFYHSPSLVQHVGTVSTWGGAFHQSADFDPEWKAPVAEATAIAARRSRQTGLAPVETSGPALQQ
jgi:ADP-heptose:LPS heptosyltransferase